MKKKITTGTGQEFNLAFLINQGGKQELSLSIAFINPEDNAHHHLMLFVTSKSELLDALMTLSEDSEEKAFKGLQKFKRDGRLEASYQQVDIIRNEQPGTAWFKLLKPFLKIDIWGTIKDAGFHQLLPEK